MAHELHASGSPRPLDEALRAARPTGRTRLYGPPKLRAIDKSNEVFDLTYFDPPAGLERHVLALFESKFRTEPVYDRHPGALGQLFFVINGRATGHFDDRTDIVETSPILLNAFDVATPFKAEGPFWCIGASLSPFGWAALTQASVYDHRNRYIPAGELIGADVDWLQERFRHGRRSGEMTSEAACVELADWIAERLSPIPETHEALIEKTLAWLGSSLNPPVEELFEGCTYSRRQVERLVQQYFGFAPRGLARKFRAIRAANLLAQPDLTDEGEAEIACAFVDQPHMIREIRRFCGYTPSRLGGCDDAMFLRLTNMQNLDRFRPYRAVGTDGETDGPPL
ncbi:MAG: helix-turn-helix domain-containing protein [Pseudomonadota bacterium]